MARITRSASRVASLAELKAARERLQQEVDNLNKLVDEAEKNLQSLQLTNSAEISTVSADPLRAAIALQESKLLEDTPPALSPSLAGNALPETGKDSMFGARVGAFAEVQ